MVVGVGEVEAAVRAQRHPEGMIQLNPGGQEAVSEGGRFIGVRYLTDDNGAHLQVAG